MLNELLAPESSTGHLDVLSFLKGKDNPFDVFIAARHADGEFPSYHVPAVHRDAMEAISAVINRYRPERLQWESDLPRSGVVVIYGSRGNGKTHMVHALSRSMSPPSVLVAPSIYEPHRPFAEYLLHQLVRHFQKESERQHGGTLDLLGEALARKVVVQALHGMTEIDWLCRNLRGPWRLTNSSFLTYFLGWGTKPVADRKRYLIQDLETKEMKPLLEVCNQNEQDPEDFRRIALQHIEQAESEHTIGGQIRRGLYTRLVDRAFGNPREDIYDFLLDGYTQVEAKTQPSRETLVDELFQALVELCLLARMPVVFAFDALETLLGEPPDPKLWHSFTNGLADVLDSHRGIPFLIFAEYGNWQVGQKNISLYAQHRFQQGVIRVPGRGSLSSLPLPDEVSFSDLSQIVAARMRPLLEQFFECSNFDVSSTFPFQEEELKGIARTTVGNKRPLRQALQVLRDRYEELVNGKSVSGQAGPTAPLPPPPGLLISDQIETAWKKELRLSTRRLAEVTMTGLADELHDGILKWLQLLIAEGTTIPAGRPTSAKNDTVGEHPTYGQITRYQWSQAAGSRNIGLGLLVAGGKGMARDLETKLKIAAANSEPLDSLIVIWPKGSDLTGPIHEYLPPATAEIWKKFEKRGTTQKVQLRSIAPDVLATWLATPSWLTSVQTEINNPPTDLLRHFIAEQPETVKLLGLLAPGS
jgi:hypothetical protein